jgi:hypothetical protein
MRRALCAAAVCAALVVAGPAHAAAVPPLSVEVDRTSIRTDLGQTFSLRTTIRNQGSAAASGLVAHLNVLSLRPGTYVDPEDWSTTRTRYLPPIPAGGSTTSTWRVTGVHSGAIGVYVAVLPANGAGSPVVTPTVRVDIATRKTVEASGVVPIALGVPAVVIVLILAVAARRRR